MRSKKSILIKQIQQLQGVENALMLAISPESNDFIVVEIYFDPETVENQENEIKPSSIDINELLDYKNTQTHLYAKEGKKELRLTFNSSFEVWNGKERVLETIQPYSAKQCFDSLNNF